MTTLEQRKEALKALEPAISHCDTPYNGEPYIAVRYAGNGYGSDSLMQANLNVLQETYPGLLDYKGEIDFEVLESMNEEKFEEFCDTMQALCDYPVIDDDELYQVESDSCEEYWTDLVERDTASAFEETFETEEAPKDFMAFAKELYWAFNDGKHGFMDGEAGYYFTYEREFPTMAVQAWQYRDLITEVR